MKQIYLDNAATTQVDPQIFRKMSPFFLTKYGNASEPHVLGIEAREAIEDGRARIASFLGDDPSTIIFTGSATESINLSHKGLIESTKLKPLSKKAHIITSRVEHRAVIMTCKHLDTLKQAETTYLPVDSFGKVKLAILEKAIKNETVLVSIMYVNNEVGTIQPIREIGNLIRKLNKKRRTKMLPRIYFHTDATQAIGYLNCDVGYLGVDFLSFTGHKISAPKGIGVLYAKDPGVLVPQIDGGDQEAGLRSGTENVPYIVGIAKAIDLIDKTTKAELFLVKQLRDKLINGLLKIPDVKLTGHPIDRIHHIASFVAKDVDGDAVVRMLSDLGIIISSGSACTSNTRVPSRVLMAMGIEAEDTVGAIRFSLCKNTIKKDIDYVLKTFPEVIFKQRKTTPK
jgi:cysteine desulfurase